MSNDAVILVGAFERDNFGDLLFGIRTQRYLDGNPARFAAPFTGTADELLGAKVERYSRVVGEGPPPAVWVVGGEVGGVTLEVAYSMDVDDSTYAEFARLRHRERVGRLEHLTGLGRHSLAYLPRMSALSNTHGAVSVINSVGLRMMTRLSGSARDEAWQSLREAAYISVRDRGSSELLRRAGVQHKLAPDLIHSLRLEFGVGPATPDLALLQVREHDLNRFGAAALAEQIVNSATLSRFHVRLFSAGSARGHDSLRGYRAVVTEVRRRSPKFRIDISTCSDPLDKAREIAGAGLWIGTSLHGLIISSAFDVPRVGLKVQKVSEYASTWDEMMPYDVPLTSLNDAADEALHLAQQSRESGRAMDLALLAHESARSAAEAIQREPRADVAATRHADGALLEKRRHTAKRRLVDGSQPQRAAVRKAGNGLLRALHLR